MISRSSITSAQGASSYYTSQARAAEYYSGEAVPSAWSGKAAAAMGLSGKVDPQALTNILQGKVIERDPKTGEARERQLGRMVHGEHQHRAGQDFTISAPKSVSLEALVHGSDAALQAHRTAVAEALRYLEAHASQARVLGKTVATDGLAIATFEHVSTRAQDPQLHTHALIANCTFYNGKAYSLSNEKLLEHRSAADAVYHNTLSRELQRAGYQVAHDRAGRVEIAGYTRDQLKDFSTRSAEIEKALAARGLTRGTSSAEARNIAALSTRASKDLPEAREAHIARWQAQAAALGIRPATRDPAIARDLQARQNPAEAAREAVNSAKQHLTEREFIMKPQDLHQQAARFSQGTTTQAAIEKEIERQVRNGDLLRDATGRLTTAEAIRAERDMDTALRAGRGAHEAVMTTREFSAALAEFERRKGFSLSDEQRSAARMILTGDDRFQGVQGLAGTGKTTLLEFVREAAESKGWSVVGHSNGSEQAANMERESGIRSTTTASHLIEQRKELAEQNIKPDHIAAPRKELRIMDEAGQAGQSEFNKVIQTTQQSGARTVFLGDKLQHQAVEAGRAFERAQSSMPVAKLGAASIRRQTNEHMKEAVRDILDKRHAAALARIEVREVRDAQSKLPPDATREQKREAARQDNQSLIQRIAKDYTSLTPDQRNKTLIVTATNADRRAINQAIRDQLKAKGELGKGAEIQILRKSDMSLQESKRAENYGPGQIIQTTSETRSLAKGAQLEVVRVDSRTNTITARDTSGREHVIDPSKTRLQTYNTETREFAPGDRIKFTENHKLQTRGAAHGEGLAVRNGQTARVEAVNDRTVTLRIGEGEKAQMVEIERAGALKAEHAYASTSHAAQGQTVDKVMIHHNTEAGRHGDRETYVNITRAREGATLYTQDLAKAERQAGVELQKTSAHDIIPDRPAERGDPTQPQRDPGINPQPSKDLSPDRAPEREREHGYW
jgi:conjugative relaxase-like TrwC/TraI family protein